MSSLPLPLLQVAQDQLVRYVSLTLVASGTIGNILNCFIFTRRSLRRSSCSAYFFAISIANLVAIFVGCLTRVLISFGIYPLSSQLSFYCKFRTFFTFASLTASTWFAVAACADRYASSSSSVRIRSFSEIKVAYRVIFGIGFIACLTQAQMFVCFDGGFRGVNCYPTTPFCTMLNDISLLIFIGLPPIFMFLLGWMTIRHVRRRPVNRLSNVKDRQLTSMLIAQVACVATFSLPISIHKFYIQFTANGNKSPEQAQVENFISVLVTLLALVNTSTSFYMFTLTSQLFRKELKPLLFFSNRRRNNVQPN